jgi:hypothetical protein
MSDPKQETGEKPVALMFLMGVIGFMLVALALKLLGVF